MYLMGDCCRVGGVFLGLGADVLMVFCVSEEAQQRAKQVSLYSCCCSKRTACVAAERGSRCFRVSSCCQQPLAVVGQDSLAEDKEAKQRHGFVEYGREWKMLVVAGRVRTGQRRVIADDRRHGMTRVMMCSGGWCWLAVPWLAWIADALSPAVARAGHFIT
jgi:hypothetical protein